MRDRRKGRAILKYKTEGTGDVFQQKTYPFHGGHEGQKRSTARRAPRRAKLVEFKFTCTNGKWVHDQHKAQAYDAQRKREAMIILLCLGLSFEVRLGVNIFS